LDLQKLKTKYEFYSNSKKYNKKLVEL